MRPYNAIDCPEIYGDGLITLEELAKLVPVMQKKYGKRAVLCFDAGWNNVESTIIPSKKVKLKQ